MHTARGFWNVAVNRRYTSFAQEHLAAYRNQQMRSASRSSSGVNISTAERKGTSGTGQLMVAPAERERRELLSRKYDEIRQDLQDELDKQYEG